MQSNKVFEYFIFNNTLFSFKEIPYKEGLVKPEQVVLGLQVGSALSIFQLIGIKTG